MWHKHNQTPDNGPPLHTTLRLLYFFRNSDPNAEIYLLNLFQWEECNPFFLVHWDKKIKLAWKKLYKNNSSVLEGFITKAKWGKKPQNKTKPKQQQQKKKKSATPPKKNTTTTTTKKNQNQPKSKQTSRQPLFQKKLTTAYLEVLCCLIKCKPPHTQSSLPSSLLSTHLTRDILPLAVGWRRPSIMFASPQLDSILLQDSVPMKLEAA